MAFPVVRPLGSYEQFSSSRHSLGIYKNVITVCRYALPAKQQDEKRVQARIERAIAGVVRKLPSLRVGIAGEDTKQPVFVAVPSLDLREHVEWGSLGGGGDDFDNALLAWVARETVRPWPDVAVHPAWRLVGFVHGAAGQAAGWIELAFEVHHALGDGLSGVVFHKRLVEELNENDDDDDDDDDDDSSLLRFDDPPRIVPPQETLVRFSTSWRFLAQTLWAEFGPAWLQATPPPVEPFTGLRPPRHALDPGHLRLFSVPAATAAALLAACRAHGTTLTPLLHALVLAQLARRFPASVAPAMSCQTPISLRPFVGPTDDNDPDLDVNRQLANLVAGHNYAIPDAVLAQMRAADLVDPADASAAVWAAAATIGADLAARVATIRQDNVSGLMAWVGDWHAWWRGQAGKPRDATWEVSNLGVVAPAGASPAAAAAAAAARPWSLTRCFYTYSLMGGTPLLSVHAASIRGGLLTVVAAWQDDAFEDGEGEAVMRDLEACLALFAKTGRFVVDAGRSS